MKTKLNKRGRKTLDRFGLQLDQIQGEPEEKQPMTET